MESVLETCRQIISRYFPNPSLDFDSKIYAQEVKEDILLVKNSLKSGDKVLDLGCGKGHITALLAQAGFNSFGTDLMQTPGESFVGSLENDAPLRWQAKIWPEIRRIYHNNYVFYDGQNIPFSDNSFNAVVAYAVIEHIPKPDWAIILPEVSRVLKPKGMFFIFRCPREQAYQERLVRLLGSFGLKSHDVLVGEGEIRASLEKHNFKILNFGRTDMIPGFLPKPVVPLWNSLFPLLNVLDRLLLSTPLSYFAHHMRVVCQKN